jgi:O-succinylbenzoate synthase
VSAALAAAEAAGIPTIASSALETSVGLAAVLAIAAALPDAPFAHGVGTASLLASDVSAEPLVPVEGWLTPRRVSPDLLMEATGA